MEAHALKDWYDEYLATFVACARGEADVRSLLGYYAAPVIVTSDDGAVTLSTDEAVAAVLQGQLDGLRTQGYHSARILNFDATVLNSSSAIIRLSVSRRDRRGAEIGAPSITYLVTEQADGPRFSVLAAH